MPVQIQNLLQKYASEIENYLTDLFDKKNRFFRHTPQTLKEAMAYSLLAGGKRLRPALLLATAESLGVSRTPLIPFAAAVEMVHTYSLIHDDLPAMDDDDFRRGKPTNHKVYGEDLAILAGDALLTQAFQLVTEHSEKISFPPVLAVKMIHELSSAAGSSGMVGGQVLDIRQPAALTAPSAMKEGDFSYLQHMHLMKTAALIGGSIRMGALAAKADEQLLDSFTEFGRHLGLAFQIQDDLLDVVGEDAEIGKLTGSDLRGGKYTYVSHFGIEGTRQQVHEHIQKAKLALQEINLGTSLLAQIAEQLLQRKM